METRDKKFFWITTLWSAYRCENFPLGVGLVPSSDLCVPKFQIYHTYLWKLP